MEEPAVAPHGGGAELLEQVALRRGVVVLDVIFARQSAEALEIVRHAPVQRGCEFGDLFIFERRCPVESWRELSRHAAVNTIEHERVKVQIEIERAAKALHEDHRSRARARDALLASSTFEAGPRSRRGRAAGASDSRPRHRPRHRARATTSRVSRGGRNNTDARPQNRPPCARPE